tara:strand:+ start:282 stop:548 length:267 start_codon:yes stop_codon:yes gene_type:complete
VEWLASGYLTHTLPREVTQWPATGTTFLSLPTTVGTIQPFVTYKMKAAMKIPILYGQVCLPALTPETQRMMAVVAELVPVLSATPTRG